MMFRGKRKDNGEWVKGDLHICKGKAKTRTFRYDSQKPEYCDKELDICWILKTHLPDTEVFQIQDTFQAFIVHKQSIAMKTGLQDKNGNDIYGSIEIDGDMTK